MTEINHKHLLKIVKCLPQDYSPWGSEIRWRDPNLSYPDCSWGCKFAVPLEGEFGADWVVCSNPDSHRAGLLTFEHQGCQKWVDDGKE